MLLCHRGLLKVKTQRAKEREGESEDACFFSQLKHTQTHTPSNNDKFVFQGQVSEQEGSGAGGAEKLAGLQGWAGLHASWLPQPTAPTFSLYCVSIQEYTVHPVPVTGEEGRRNRREPVQY